MTANNVQVFREALMWSPADLARISGVSALTISNYESGAPVKPRLETKKKLADAFKKEVWEVFPPRLAGALKERQLTVEELSTRSGVRAKVIQNILHGFRCTEEVQEAILEVLKKKKEELFPSEEDAPYYLMARWEEEGYDQKSFAQKVGIAGNTLIEAAKGEKNIRQSTKAIIARGLNDEIQNVFPVITSSPLEVQEDTTERRPIRTERKKKIVEILAGKKKRTNENEDPLQLALRNSGCKNIAELARIAETSPQHLTNIFNGEVPRPRYETMRRIAKACGESGIGYEEFRKKYLPKKQKGRKGERREEQKRTDRV